MTSTGVSSTGVNLDHFDLDEHQQKQGDVYRQRRRVSDDESREPGRKGLAALQDQMVAGVDGEGHCGRGMKRRL